MKICFLAPANNHHTKKWCEYFINKGHTVDVISFIDDKIKNVNVHYIKCGVEPTDKDIKKIKYLLKVNEIKKLIKKINPDIINAHFATSYGMVAALCNVEYVVSIWGSDVYRFPNKSLIHKTYFKYIIKKAKYIFSTSNTMAEEIEKYTTKKIYVTPFGVKMDLFNPKKHKSKEFIVGTVKSLKEKYGIDYIIKAIEIINNTRPDINIKVRIAGTGEKEEEYKKLAKKLNVNVEWLGLISQEQASKEWANMDVALIPSVEPSESFGVSAIEAQACETPVIITNIPGLLETTTDKSRIVIPIKNENVLAQSIIELYDNKDKRKEMGKNGRKYVLEKYEYNKFFKYIEDLFKKIYQKRM